MPKPYRNGKSVLVIDLPEDPRVEADPTRHLVQLYGEDGSALVRNVAAYLQSGLSAGDAALIIATPEHTDAFLEELSRYADPSQHSRSRPLVCLDAQAMLDRFMIDGLPDWQRFEHSIGAPLRTTRRAGTSGNVRAYGEMVGLLWMQGNVRAGVALERFWNALLERERFTLFCAYPIDIFASDVRAPEIDEIMCAHTALVPGAAALSIAGTLQRAMEDVLGERLDAVRARMEAKLLRTTGTATHVERRVLWLRENVPHDAQEIVRRARQYAAAPPAR